MTHKLTELTPSARINLIMGGNGSGKSSIVCAMCLGLGGDPSSMARSNNLKDFIMKGADAASVTIVLSGGPGRPDYTVQRTLVKDRSDATGGNTRDAVSKLFINDMLVTPIVFDKLMLDLNIQMDNQTQFLPQEKIGAFTENSPQKFLEYTMRAISTELTLEHGVLVKDSKTVGNSALVIEALQREIAEIDGKVVKLSGALGNLEAHERLDNEAKILSIQLLAAERDALLARAELVQTEAVSVEEYAKLGTEIPCVAAEVAKAADSKKEMEYQKKEADSEFKRASATVTYLTAALEDADLAIKVKTGEVTTAEKLGKQLEANLVKLESAFAASTKAHAAANAAMGTLDATTIGAARLEAIKLQAAVEGSWAEVAEAKAAVGEAGRCKTKAERYLSEVEGVPARRRDALLMHRRTLGPAIALVKAARDRKVFKGAILGPLLLDIEVVDARFAPQVELAMNSDWSRGFLALDRDDERAMGAMDLKTSYSAFSDADAKEAKAKIPSRAKIESMRVALGLTDLFCAPELVRAPDTVLGYLISKSLVHQKFITSDPAGIDKCLKNSLVLRGTEVICPDASVSFMGMYLQRSSVPKPKVLHIMLDSVKAADASAAVGAKKVAFDIATAALKALEVKAEDLNARLTFAKRTAAAAATYAKTVETTKGILVSDERRVKTHRATMASAASGKAFFAQTVHDVRSMQVVMLRGATGLGGAAKDCRVAAETSAACSLQLAYLKVQYQVLFTEHGRLKAKLNSADKNIAETAKQIADFKKGAEKMVSWERSVGGGGRPKREANSWPWRA